MALITWLSLSLPVAASVMVDVVPFTMLTSATFQDIDGNLGGTNPKGVIIIAGGGVTPGTIAAHARFSFGASSGSGQQWFITGQAEDGQTVTDTDSWQEVGSTVGIQNTDRTLMCAGSLSFHGNGIRLTQAAGCDQAYHGAVVMFGGTDTTCRAGTMVAPASIGGSTTISSLTFTPAFVFLAKTRMDEFASGGNASQIINISVAVNHPVASDVNVGVSKVAQNGQNPSASGGYVSTTSLYTLDVFTGDGEYIVESFTSSGFSVREQVEASADELGYFTCGFNGKASLYANVVDTPSGADAGAHAFSGPGFRPLLSMWLMSSLDTANSIEVAGDSGSDVGTFGVGLLRGGLAWSTSISTEDADSPAAMKSLVSTTDFQMPLHAGSLGWQGTPSHTSSGASINFATNPATARKWIYFAMKPNARRRAPGNN